MNIENSLKKEGINVVNKLNTLKVNTIAKDIAEQLCSSFPELNLVYNDIFRKLCHLKIYRATLPTDLSQAKYFYKNASIYVNSNIDIEEIEDVIIHECIHYLQEKKDEKDNLLQMGLYKIGNFSCNGLAINEASVQLMTSRCLATPKETVTYFGLTFTTTSQNYYPLECSLVSQLSYLIGDTYLYESVLLNSNVFEDQCIAHFGQKNFNTIKSNLDDLLKLEEQLNQFNYTLANTDMSAKAKSRITESVTQLKEKISKKYISTQNLIFTSYFNNFFSTLKNRQDIANFRNLLYYYTKVLGTTDNYTDFQTYYNQKVIELDNMFDALEHPSMELAVVDEHYSFFKTLIQKIRKLSLMLKNNLNYITNNNNNDKDN